MKFLLDPTLGAKARVLVRTVLAVVTALGLAGKLPFATGAVEEWVGSIATALQVVLALVVSSPFGTKAPE